MSDYSVSENAGEANDLVFVIKDNGMESEQVLPILVSLSSGLVDPATQGEAKFYSVYPLMYMYIRMQTYACACIYACRHTHVHVYTHADIRMCM